MSQYEDNEVDSKPSFEESLDELKSDSDSLPSPALVIGLSGLNMSQLDELRPVWQNLDDNYRRILMQMLVDASEANFELDFLGIGYENLKAPQAEVRQAAIELLGEDESSDLMHELIAIVQKDESLAVRTEAAKALGRFVLLGEMEEIEERDARLIQKLLLDINRTAEDINLRRYALESLGNCTNKAVSDLISQAYESDEPLLRLSAIVAMGRSYDSRWEENVLAELDSDDDDIRRAAVHSAGELQIAEAVPAIIRFLNESDDNEAHETVIQALGEIGGKEAIRVLENLMEAAEEAEDEDLIDLIDEAMSNASLADGSFMMLDLSDYNLDEEN